MATSLTVSSQFPSTSYRPEVFSDCGTEDHGRRCARKSVSVSNAWLGSGRLFQSRQLKRWHQQEARKVPLPCLALFGGKAPDDDDDEDEDDADDDSASNNDSNDMNSKIFREKMERMLDNDDVPFRGKDLATLIRKKYGRSYDVQFIKKEFLGRQLLAMNVMWKYREQRSFPLTEEEYLLHLDDIANTLRCWGAVSHVRSSIEKTKERPRIGKAVSIVIDLDEFGGRAREWINR